MEKAKVKKAKKRPQKTPRSSDASLRHFRLTIAYIGSAYQGWQKQAPSDHLPTIQETIETSIKAVLPKQKFFFHGSGRTDAGVHASRQVAHLRALVDLPTHVLIQAFNAHLPEDIRIIRLEECSADFHAQLSATSKTYRYFILLAGRPPVHWPFLRPYAWYITYPLDLSLMREALKELEGSHDFRSFQNRGTPVKDTVRQIFQAELIEHKYDSAVSPPWMPPPELNTKLIEIRIHGDGFLKQMVRTIVGTIVSVGRGKLQPKDLRSILEKKSRESSGMTAPAHGLFLDLVDY